MNSNANIIKYTKLYKYTQQYLATGTHAPSNEHKRTDAVSTASPVKCGGVEITPSVGQTQEPSEENRNRTPHGW